MDRSFIVDSKAYVKRYLYLNKIKGRVESKLFIRQKQLCLFCGKFLIKGDVNLVLETFDEFRDLGNGVDFSLPISKDVSVLRIYQLEGFFEDKVWFKALYLVYLIPLRVSGLFEALKSILINLDNLALVHKHCYKQKLFKNEMIFSILYRRVRNSFFPFGRKNISKLTSLELKIVNLKTILYLHDNKNFDKFIVNSSTSRVLKRLIRKVYIFLKIFN